MKEIIAIKHLGRGGEKYITMESLQGTAFSFPDWKRESENVLTNYYRVPLSAL